ncbi:myb-like protein X isoform X2 [Ceratitis capitata]|nr:myb-like protein X isoform X2 [Ceratitis capitata]XP_023158350.1 myb-like protein X isoform X2 [Ceratitis capitata]
MAHVVGVPKRDPCQKCQLPVFLAERLLVGKKVYHRTCLKCARCGSQLTPGSFYETEVDGEYCCETCPDEEVQLNASTGGDLAASSVQLRRGSDDQTPSTSSTFKTALPKNARSSIADRLAFFEQAKKDANSPKSSETAASSKFLLQKSVSDEEKSKSLQRMEAPTTTSTYKINSALSSFLNDTIDGEGAGESEDADAESLSHNTVGSKSGTETQMETSDTENDAEEPSLDDVAPALPRTQPPSVAEEAQQTNDVYKEKAAAENKRFTATAQLQLGSTAQETAQPQAFESTEETYEEISEQIANERKTELNVTTTTASLTTPLREQADNVNNNGHQQDDFKTIPTKAAEQKAQTSLTATNNLDLSEPNSNEDVTKDQIADTNVIAAATAQTPTQVPSALASNTTEKLEKLRANLKELDTESGTENMDTTNEKPVEMRVKSLESPEDKATTERLSVVRARLQQFEVIANKHNNNASEEKQADNNTHNDNNTVTNNDVKLSEPEIVSTNTNSYKKILNTGVEVAAKMDETNSTTASTPATATTTRASNETRETESLTKENLEDEAKLRAMEIEKSEKIETKTREIMELEESNVNEVPLELETEVKDNNIVLDVKQGSEPKPALRTPTITPRIEVSKVEHSEEAATKDLTATKQAAKEGESIDSTSQPTPVAAARAEIVEKLTATPNKTTPDEYPEDLNPFKSDDEDEEADMNKENLQTPQCMEIRTPQPRTVSSDNTSTNAKSTEKPQSLNPFDSSDDEIELEKSSRNSTAASTPSTGKVPPPRPPPPRISRNPFGEEADEVASNFSRRSSLSSSLTKKTPVPTPRTNL